MTKQDVKLAGFNAQSQILDREFVAVRSVNLLKINHRDSERGAAIVATRDAREFHALVRRKEQIDVSINALALLSVQQDVGVARDLLVMLLHSACLI